MQDDEKVMVPEQEMEILHQKAELPFSVKFIPFYVHIQFEFNLSDLETKIYGFIELFTSNGSEFYVSDEKLGQFFNVNKFTINRSISSLKEKGLIICSYFLEKGFKKIRKLRIAENVNTILRKNATGSCEKTQAPIAENSNLYITLINNNKNKNDHSKKKLKKNVENENPQFEEFWKKYPRKIAKAKALKIFNALSSESRAKILEVIDEHVRMNNWSETPPRFIPHASTWLNQERFNDELELTEQKKPPKEMSADEVRERLRSVPIN